MSGDSGGLPVLAAMPALRAALAAPGVAVLQAPPGAGKSTAVPLELLDEPWLAGQRLLMLEPRRLAARAVATRMATMLGEQVGDTVGYRTRLDSRVGRRTRIEVVTEGILNRRLHGDPGLENIGCILFDEFHERSLQADLGLTLTLDCREHLRPDLRLLVMSATLDATAVAGLLGDAPVVTASGLSHPVETRWLERPAGDRIEPAVVAAIVSALRDEPGDILVFLPGAAEIRRVATALALRELPRGTAVLPLYGDLDQDAQDRAISPARPGERKVVLSTNIAETSLTIEGVRIVIDSGLERRACFDPGSGMSRLETRSIPVASADQRRGRAGRLGPGLCLRLWTEAQQRTFAAHGEPEIAVADLAPLALELAGWGADAVSLAWLDPPPAATLAQARDLLGSLGAIDRSGRITAHGREMAALGAHPRLAHLLIRGREAGLARTGCAIAALLTERDILRGSGRDADLRSRLDLLAHDGSRDGTGRVKRAAALYARALGTGSGTGAIDSDAAGWLLACAYPDRVGRAREQKSGRYLLASGRGARFAEPQALAASEFIVVADLDAGEREARIFLAAPIAPDDIEQHFASDIEAVEQVGWDEREQAVTARRQRRLGALLLEDKPLPRPPPSSLAAAMLAGLRSMGIAALPWTPELRQWQARVRLLARHDEREEWPDASDAALMASLEDWLLPFLDGITRRDHLARLPLADALRALLGYSLQRRLDELAPTHVVVPSGSKIAIDYLDGDTPSLAVRLQEVFGLADTPRLAGGRVAVTMKLLSPARRPVQVTQDLRSFWERGYHEVRKELKGRYPKHYWPEDPHQAQPTRRVRPG